MTRPRGAGRLRREHVDPEILSALEGLLALGFRPSSVAYACNLPLAFVREERRRLGLAAPKRNPARRSATVGKLSRNKGAQYEREVAGVLRALGAEAARNLTETREGNDGDVVNDLGLAVQCKVGEAPPIWTGFEEALADAEAKGQVPVLFAKRNRKGARAMRNLVVMRVEDWMALMHDALAHRALGPKVQGLRNQLKGER